MPKDSTPRCAACSYQPSENQNEEGPHLFKVPRDDDRREQWGKCLNLSLNKQNYVCERHFDLEQLIYSKQDVKGKRPRPTLKRGGLPKSVLNTETMDSYGMTHVEEPNLPIGWHKIETINEKNNIIYANFITNLQASSCQTLTYKEVIFRNGQFTLNVLGRAIIDKTLCSILKQHKSAKSIVELVDKLIVCQGLEPVGDIGDFEKDLAWKDSLGNWRANNCLLLLGIGGRVSKRCGYCEKFRDVQLEKCNNPKETVKIIVIRKKNFVSA